MSDLRAAAQQALEALEKTHTQPGCEQWQAERKASVALRAALEQPRQFKSFAPKPPPPAPQGYDGTEAGLQPFSWRNNE